MYTTDPTDADAGIELSDGGYARQAVAFGEPADGVTSNSADVLFPVAAEPWGTITHIGIIDAASGGNLLFHGALDAPQTIDISSQFKISAGNLAISLA
mgnify:CR=1 FL=1